MTSRHTSRSPRLALSLVTVLLLAACVSKAGSRAGAGGTPESTDTVTTGTPGATAQLPDRDPQEVEEGLVEIGDPCTLVDVGVLQEHGFPTSQGEQAGRECSVLTSEYSTRITVLLGEDFPPSAQYAMRPIEPGGYKAYIQDLTLAPDLEWTCGVAVPISFEESISLTVRRDRQQQQFDPCKLVEALAGKAVTYIANVAPALLFRPDEPDENAEGACMHWLSAGTHAGCVPYREMDVPDDARQMVEAAAGNAHVTCAAARDVVLDVFGDTMEPIVYGQHCVFVEPTHEITFSVLMSDGYVPGEYGVDPNNPRDVEPSRAKERVSGHPAIVLSGSDSDGTTLWREYHVSITDDVQKPGTVSGDIQVDAPRGSSQDAQADQTKLPLVLVAMEKLMNEYF